ncbi:MAG: STAS-like domain-containing protein [Acidimicrobiales bacterium]
MTAAGSACYAFTELMESAQEGRPMQYDVSKWGVFLATRERGRQVREEIQEKLRELRSGETLELSFKGIEGITVSFGDECVAKLIIERSMGTLVDRGLVIDGANDVVREELEAVLSRMKISAVSMDAAGHPEILGERGWLPATLEAAMELRSFSASEVADKLNLTPQAANNRLKVLVASGAVVRQRVVPEGGGKEFSYTVVIPAYA